MTIVPRPRALSCGAIGLPGTSSHREEPFSAFAYVRAVSCSFHRRESISVSSELRADRAAVIADARRAEASGMSPDTASASPRAASSASLAGTIESASSPLMRVCAAHSSSTSTRNAPELTVTSRRGSNAMVTTLPA